MDKFQKLREIRKMLLEKEDLPIVKSFDSNLCPDCLVLYIEIEEGNCCPMCGLMIPKIISDVSLDQTSNSVTYSAYSRLSHFKNLLYKFSGRSNVPNTVIDVLSNYFAKNEIEINHANIRQALKTLKYSKHYNDIPLILNKLVGVPTVDISKIEKQLTHKFIELNEKYSKVEKKYKIFFNYSYCLHKLFLDYKIEYPIYISQVSMNKYDVLWETINAVKL